MPSLSEANAKFGFSIFREFKQNAEDNLVISPLSISTVMAMVLLGAREKTAFEMQKVLCLDEVTKGGRPSVGDSRGISVEAVSGTPGEIHSQFHSLLEEINKPNDDYSLAVANRLYGSQTFEFLQPYLDGVKDVYKAGLETMDFLHASEDSRGKINSWVENQTNGKIKELFSAGTIDPATVLVLANAIYFKGKWAMKFKQENTQERNFRTNKLCTAEIECWNVRGDIETSLVSEASEQMGKLLEAKLSCVLRLEPNSFGCRGSEGKKALQLHGLGCLAGRRRESSFGSPWEAWALLEHSKKGLETWYMVIMLGCWATELSD
ncbi:serpin B4-like isoform X3 [Notamacropus eugenii]|uniref:serpin B4-like isoform X3 n=1 Tax=Notamacropus eugenii TaxID=9315 RepID=UPI003B67E3EE